MDFPKFCLLQANAFPGVGSARTCDRIELDAINLKRDQVYRFDFVQNPAGLPTPPFLFTYIIFHAIPVWYDRVFCRRPV